MSLASEVIENIGETQKLGPKCQVYNQKPGNQMLGNLFEGVLKFGIINVCV